MENNVAQQDTLNGLEYIICVVVINQDTLGTQANVADKGIKEETNRYLSK